jgi:hypothetical protein
MNNLEYVISIIYCLPVLILLDQDRLKLALIFWIFLMFPIGVVYSFPENKWLFDSRWILWFIELFYIAHVIKSNCSLALITFDTASKTPMVSPSGRLPD